jgi:hypothetical protein
MSPPILKGYTYGGRRNVGEVSGNTWSVDNIV